MDFDDLAGFGPRPPVVILTGADWRFWHLYGHADLDPRTTLIITGDGRNNYRDAALEALRSIHERARKVYWLNPEPRREWNTSDSIMETYAPSCHGVFEARNLRQLAEFAYQIA